MTGTATPTTGRTSQEKGAPPLWAHQEEALEFAKDKPGVMLALEMGTGKDLDNDTPIPTPNGWTRMGDIQPGDTVFDERGNTCTVTAVFPQGEKQTYIVEFDEGTKIIAGAEHQWITLTHLDRARIHRRKRNLDDWSARLMPTTTEQMARSLIHRRGALVESMHSIPTAKPLHLPDKELPVDPYTLGLWLGDGFSGEPAICCHQDDEHHYGKAVLSAEENRRVRDRKGNVITATMAGEPAPRMATRLKEMKVWKNKNIPREYLRASAEQRLKLLQGLMDTDGYTGRQGDAEFTSTSRKLAEGVLALALSMGQKATMTEGIATLNGVEVSPKYRVRFTPDINVFSLPRKADHLERFLKRRTETPLTRMKQRYIRDIKKGEVKNTTCITVDSPSSLFLAGREMVPTHNTRCAIEHIHRTGSKRVLVIAPLSVVDHVWEDQINLHSPVPMSVVTLGQRHTSTAKKIKAAEMVLLRSGRNTPVVVIVNYETTLRDEFRLWAEKRQWDMLVLDESHRIKSPKGQTSRWLGVFARRVPNRIALTGTPMPHSPMDVFAQFRALDDTIFGTDFVRFRDRYALLEPVRPRHDATEEQKRKLKNAKQIAEYRNLDELAGLMGRITFEVKADDVLDLPPAHHFTYRTAMNPKAEKAYWELHDDFVAILDADEAVHADNALVQLLRLQQMTSGFVTDDEGRVTRLDRSKSTALEEILDAMPQDEPLVVFGRFLEDLKEIQEAAGQAGRPAFEYSGAVKQLNLWKKEGGVLAAQIQTGSVGVDMTEARYCVYYSLGFSLGDYLQSLARTHRAGQEKPVRYVHLLAANTVDEAVMRSLEKKEDVVRSILDSRSLNPSR